MKRIILNLFAIFSFTTFVACEDDANIREYTYPMPEVHMVSPTFGYPQSIVAIKGSNFVQNGNLEIPAIKISVGGVEVPSVLYAGDPILGGILSASEDQIRFVLPDKVVSGDIDLQIYTNKIEKVSEFIVLTPPLIESVKSQGSLGEQVAAVGDNVLIEGVGFDNGVDAPIVSFNGTRAEVVSYIDTEIVAETPAGYQSGSLSITIGSYILVGPGLVNPSMPGDVSAVFLKNYKSPFAFNSDYDIDWTTVGTPSDWLFTPAIQTFDPDADGSYTGGVILDKGKYVDGVEGDVNRGVIGVECAYGARLTSVVNGKLYQTATLPAGKYEFSATLQEASKGSSSDYTAFFAVTKGTEMLDVTVLAEGTDADIIAHEQIIQGVTPQGSVVKLNFTLTQATDVSLGLVVNFVGQNNIFFNDFKLEIVK